MRQTLIAALQAALLFMVSTQALATTYDLPANGDNIVGEIIKTHPQPGEKLTDIARRYDIGYYEIVNANPGVDPKAELSPGDSIVIPSRFILPNAERKGIVINLVELRLYYYPPDTNEVITKPVGIGKLGWDTPVGETKIISKVKNPTWRPTERVKQDALAQGYIIPDVWPAGPDNPLGQYKMLLGWESFLIHGTNRPEGVGKRSSAGCIRMYPEDIEMLYSMAKIGTPVGVVNSPVKVGWENDKIYIQVNKPLVDMEKAEDNRSQEAVQNIYQAAKDHHAVISWQKVEAQIQQVSGVPVVIGKSQPLLANDSTEKETHNAVEQTNTAVKAKGLDGASVMLDPHVPPQIEPEEMHG